jgi:hypothetical protein
MQLEKWVFEFKFDVKEFVEERREAYKEQQRQLARLAALEEELPKE